MAAAPGKRRPERELPRGSGGQARSGEAGGAGRRRAEEGGGAGSGPRAAAAMAQCVQSVQEFIQDSFVPLVAALCSEEAERLTGKNSLSFAELVKPFCRLTSEGRSWERSGAGRAACLHGAGRAGRRRSLPPAGPGVPPGRRSGGGSPLCPARPSRAKAGGKTPFPGPWWRPLGRALPGAVTGFAEARVCRGCPRWL